MRGELVETAGVKSVSGRPYSPALRIGDWVLMSGQVPIDAEGNDVTDDAATQWRQTLDNIKELVESAGGSMADVVRINVFVTDIRHYLNHGDIRKEYFDEPYPICTALAVSGLAREDWVIEIEAIAYLGS
jgi:2-iminobutanoate/2-iminopropanoate deaminase